MSHPINFNKIIAHRGACAYAPENTLASFKKASEMNASWVEYDIRLTQDDKLICIHDRTLERTTNGSGYVLAQEYKDIEKLDAGSWFSNEFKGEKIPSFGEVIQCCAQLKLKMNVQLRLPVARRVHHMVDIVLADLDAHWPLDFEKPLLSTDHSTVLAEVHYQNPKYPLGFIMDKWDPYWEYIADQIHAVTINIDEALATKENVDAIKSTGRQVLVYTINDVEKAKNLFELGVDAIFSDRPDLLGG